MCYFMLRPKSQHIVMPCSAPEYRKCDICQPFITEMQQYMFRIHSHPQIHITTHGVTPGDVHFSLGLDNLKWQISLLIE